MPPSKKRKISPNSSSVLNPNRLQDMCRTCLTNTSNVSLFVPVYDEGETFSLWELYENCTRLSVDENDSLPKAVCDECLAVLVSLNRFIKKCKSADMTIKSIMGVEQNHLKPAENDSSGVNTGSAKQDIVEGECKPYRSTDICEAEPEVEDINIKQLLGSDILLTDSIEIKHVVPKAKVGPDKKKKGGKQLYNKQYLCNICLKSCSSQSRLTDHFRSHTNERPFACDKCGAKFSLHSNLNRHMSMHTGEKPHICKHCNKGFSQSSSLTSHLRLHTIGNTYKCRCGLSFHPDTQCSFATARSKTTRKVNDRYRNRCKECDSIYTKACQENNHSLAKDNKWYLCSVCGKEFISKAGLEHHYRVHNGERPYKCRTCDKSFKNATGLKMHSLTHTDERSYLCRFCGKCFKQPSHLKYHLLLHTGEKAYSCTYCSKAFALKGNLTQHLRVHTDEMRFQCSECNKYFRNRNSWSKHVNSHKVITVIKPSVNVVNKNK